MEKEIKSVKELLVLEADQLSKEGTHKETALFKVLNEQNRFNQDCRKRALDLAHSEYHAVIAASQATKGGEIDVLGIADKYYEWLTKVV